MDVEKIEFSEADLKKLEKFCRFAAAMGHFDGENPLAERAEERHPLSGSTE